MSVYLIYWMQKHFKLVDPTCSGRTSIRSVDNLITIYYHYREEVITDGNTPKEGKTC